MKTREEIVAQFNTALNDMSMHAQSYANTEDEVCRIAARIAEERARTLWWTLGDPDLRERMLNKIDSAHKLLDPNT
jgi:uncharacterized protein YydD (DUF2326 family)